MSLASLLPKPKNQLFTQPELKEDRFTALTTTKKEIPPYGKRDGWVPRALEDFGDGGAFPEIHVAQYPQNMGRKKTAGEKTLTLQVDAEGKVKYDAIARQGHGADRVIHSTFNALVPKDIKENDTSFEQPDEEQVKETTEKTRLALEKMLEGKIKAKMPKEAVHQSNEPTYIRYTPTQQGPGFNSGAQNRVIKMVEVQRDPMEPPKFRHKKVPRGPPSPPAPVMHSPPKKVSVEEQNQWKIPPCISNWKNPKGYTIPLDKRLAADGRGLQETYVNDKFAQMAQSLIQAERQAHEEVRLRNLVDVRIKEKESKEKEEKIRQLAQQAREEKLGRLSTKAEEEEEEEEEEEDREKLKEREEIRRDKRKEIERELRMSRMSAENKSKLLEREKDRDVSEKIALGLAKPTASQELMYDQRLFNRSQGVGSGFGDDEAYDLYDKPLFSGSSANAVYRPRRGAEDEFAGTEEDVKKIVNTERFIPDKGFQGADKAQKRDGPVEFEAAQADPFGLDQFMKEARQGKRPLDKIGENGQMKAGGGGYEGGSGRKRIDFDSSERDSKRRR